MREGRTRKIVCNERVRKRDKRKMYYMREKKRQKEKLRSRTTAVF